MISRRQFFASTAGSIVAASLIERGLQARAAGWLPLGMPLGGQVYPHRQRVVDGGLDGFAGLMKDMKALGVGIVELDSPGYKEFAALADGKATRKILDDNGIKCPSVHFTMSELRTKLAQAIEWNHAVGADQVSTASLGGKMTNGMTTLDEVKRAADEYNGFGDVVAKSGMIMTLHNETFEHAKIEDGRLVYHVLFDYLNPKTVFMQYQMSSYRITGDPVMLFTKYPNRFRSMHLQGIPPVAPAPPPAAADAGQPAAGRRAGGAGGGAQVAVGSPTDTLDWPKIFPAAKKPGGITNYFVEQNWDLFVQSIAYLKTLNV
jgi:sugar phosphate isomerase/epimerase